MIGDKSGEDFVRILPAARATRDWLSVVTLFALFISREYILCNS